MSFVEQVGVLILTYNEGPNIERTLGKLGWARRILIIDSGSTDETIEIARTHPQVEVIYRSFDDFASQCNFGLSRIESRWILSLDADYELSDALVEELDGLTPTTNVCGYRARFVYCVYGQPLRGTLYPSRVVLYRREGAHYRKVGHGHQVILDGQVEPLVNPIHHDDRKSLSRWFDTQQRYAHQEAEYIDTNTILNRADRVRGMMWPAPFLVFLYTLVVKGCLLDGWPGWFYALQRLLAETMLALALLERRIGGASAKETN